MMIQVGVFLIGAGVVCVAFEQVEVALGLIIVAMTLVWLADDPRHPPVHTATAAVTTAHVGSAR